jgi:hypothetical protein
MIGTWNTFNAPSGVRPPALAGKGPPGTTHPATVVLARLGYLVAARELGRFE